MQELNSGSKPNKVIIQSHASFGSSSGLIFSIPSQSSKHSGGPSSPPSPLSSHSPIDSSQFSGPQVVGYNNPSTQVTAWPQIASGSQSFQL